MASYLNLYKGLFSIILAILIITIQARRISQQSTLDREVFISESSELFLQREASRLLILQTMPSLGFDNIISSWIYLDFLQYFGDLETRNQFGYSLSPDFFRVIIKHDPYFIHAYLFLSYSTSLRAGKPEESVELMELGLESMSPTAPDRSFLVWRYKGIDELLFLGNSEAAKQSFLTAANWAQYHTDPEAQDIAQTSLRTAQFLSEDPDSTQAQVATWLSVFINAVDDSTREIAQNNIEGLGFELVVSEAGIVSVNPINQEN